MPHSYLNPPDLFDARPFGFTQVVTSQATDASWVYCSGQTAWDTQCKLTEGTDFASQLTAAFANVRRALAAGSAEAKDVVRITLYIVDHQVEYLALIGAAMGALFGDALPASTIVGVQRLALPDLLVEVEVTARKAA